jgi:thiol-disulfide isomerase/thioredoxin
MKIRILSLIIASVLYFQQSNAQEKFVLEGKLTGFEPGIKFVISPSLPDMNVDRDRDSTMYLTNGEFKLSGNIKEPTKYSLRAFPKIPPDNPNDYEFLSFWVENKPMVLKGEKGNLQFSDISGSEIQDQYEELMNISKAREKINKQIKDSVLTYNLSEEAREPLREIRDNNMDMIMKERLEFIYNHPDYLSCVAELVSYINFYDEKLSKVRALDFYQSLSYDFKNNAYGKQIKNYIDNLPSTSNANLMTNSPMAGKKPFLFALPDSIGNNLDFASLNGKIILLDFWASGCGPCRQEHKNYLEVYKKYRAKGFEILSVSQDQSKKQWVKAMVKDNMIWKSVWDSDRKVTKMYSVTNIPANYLINVDGTIIETDLRGDKLSEKLDELLNKK